MKQKEPWRHEVARAYGSFTHPDLAIPCRVASPQSPTLLHQARRIVDRQGQDRKRWQEPLILLPLPTYDADGDRTQLAATIGDTADFVLSTTINTTPSAR